MQIVIRPTGLIQAIYDESLDLSNFGQLHIQRASYIEPDEQGKWFVDLSPVGGPRLGPFRWRSKALLAEQVWLELNWPLVLS
jgi:hypothetical protein